MGEDYNTQKEHIDWLNKDREEQARTIDTLTRQLAAERDRAERLRERAKSVVKDIDILINNSSGVIGLHQNGDEAPWSDLIAGGKYEDWLGSVELLRAALNDTPEPPDTGAKA